MRAQCKDIGSDIRAPAERDHPEPHLLYGARIRAANAAGLDLDQHFARARFRRIAFGELPVRRAG